VLKRHLMLQAVGKVMSEMRKKCRPEDGMVTDDFIVVKAEPTDRLRENK
jgi:hypothetical protein